MKLIKHILPFFLLLILQLSFANRFASICLSKDDVVSRIEFSETAKSNPEFSKPNLKENHIFEPSFLEVVSSRSVSFCGVYAELVDAWKVLDDAGVDDALRKNVDNLTGTKNYLDNNPCSSGYAVSSQRLVAICNRRLTGSPSMYFGV